MIVLSALEIFFENALYKLTLYFLTYLLFPNGEWQVMCYQKHLETTTT